MAAIARPTHPQVTPTASSSGTSDGSLLLTPLHVPSDGTETTITVDGNGKLSADLVIVDESDGGDGGGEGDRATIHLPNARDCEGRAFFYSCPTDRLGATFTQIVSAPAAIDLTSIPITFPIAQAFSVTYDVNGTDVTVDYTVGMTLEEAGGTLFEQLVTPYGDSVAYVGDHPALQVSTFPDADEVWAAALVARDVTATLAITSVSNGDPEGIMANVVQVAPEEVVVHGVDGWAKGHTQTHANRDSGPPHGSIVVSDGVTWWWVLYSADRAELTGLVLSGGAAETLNSPTNVLQAIESVATLIEMAYTYLVGTRQSGGFDDDQLLVAAVGSVSIDSTSATAAFSLRLDDASTQNTIWVNNKTAYAVSIKSEDGATTHVTIPAGKTAVMYRLVDEFVSVVSA